MSGDWGLQFALVARQVLDFWAFLRHYVISVKNLCGYDVKMAEIVSNFKFNVAVCKYTELKVFFFCLQGVKPQRHHKAWRKYFFSVAMYMRVCFPQMLYLTHLLSKKVLIQWFHKIPWLFQAWKMTISNPLDHGENYSSKQPCRQSKSLTMSLRILSFSMRSFSFFCSRSVLAWYVATALVAFWIFAVMERWYSLKSLACCRMLLRYSCWQSTETRGCRWLEDAEKRFLIMDFFLVKSVHSCVIRRTT